MKTSSRSDPQGITVAIILHGDPPQIRQVIADVQSHQTAARPITVLCLDDGSSPRARQLLDAMGTWIIDLPKGASIAQAKNEALRRSRDELVFFLDDHIRLEPGGIAAAVEMLEGDSRLAGVCGFYHTRDETDWNVLRDIKRQTIYGKAAAPRLITLDNFTTFSTGIAIVRRSAFADFLFPEAEFPSHFGGEDVPAMLYLLNRGWHLGYHPALEGVHEHNLTRRSFLQKVEVEVRGRYSVFVWAVRNPDLTVPYLHGFLHVPILFGLCLALAPILSMFVSQWFLVLPAMLFGNECRLCLRCLRTALPYRQGTKWLAAAYVLGSDLLTLLCGMQYLVSGYKRPFQWKGRDALRMACLFLRWEFAKFTGRHTGTFNDPSTGYLPVGAAASSLSRP